MRPPWGETALHNPPRSGNPSPVEGMIGIKGLWRGIRRRIASHGPASPILGAYGHVRAFFLFRDRHAPLNRAGCAPNSLAVPEPPGSFWRQLWHSPPATAKIRALSPT